MNFFNKIFREFSFNRKSIILFLIIKIYRFFKLNKTPEISNFPYGKENIIGFQKPFLNKDHREGFYLRYYSEHIDDCNEVNNFFNLADKHLFKNEILWGKKYDKKFKFKAANDLIIPISGFNHLNQKINIHIWKKTNEKKKSEININCQRFTYISLKKNENIELSSDHEFLVCQTINRKDVEVNKNKLVLFLFVDGLFDFSKIGMQSLKSIMPKTYEFFSKGVIFNNHHANAEWTLASFPSLFTGYYTHGHKFYHPTAAHEIGNNIKTLGQLFREKNYYTFQAGGGWRMNPAYGYSKGFDRTVYRKELDCKEVINEFFENQRSFSERSKFVWLNFNDLHHSTKIIPSLSTQLDLSLDYLKDKKDTTKKKSVYSDYDPIKIEMLMKEMKRLDYFLDHIFQYIENNYKNNEFIVTLATDHGHAFLDKNTNILSVSRNSIPWFIRGNKIPEKISNEITENVDVFETLVNKCNLKNDNKDIDGNLPVDVGGDKRRKFSFAHSIYPNQTYKSTIKDKKYEFFFETTGLVNDDGSFKTNPYKCSLKFLNSSKNGHNKKIYNKYKKICIDQAERWLKLN